jgi:peptide/nickel transport system substrate-binding protein
VLNVRRPLFHSAAMRRAVNYAFDRRALARQPVRASFGRPTDQYLPPGMPGFRDQRVYPLANDTQHDFFAAHVGCQVY